MKKNKEKIQENDSARMSEIELEKERISFSSSLVYFLEEKKKAFNKKNKSNIKIQQLKEVYRRGASSATEDLNLHGLARVNMFLRMKEQKKMDTLESAKQVSPTKASELVLEDGIEVKLIDSIDISETWTPNEEDVSQAKETIKKHDLDFKFKNINELYLEPYKPIEFRWE